MSDMHEQRSAAAKPRRFPVCACHGEPVRWVKDSRKTAGGYWACRVKRRASQKKAMAIYLSTEKGHAATARYAAQPHRQLAQQLHEMTRVRVRY